VYPQFEWDDAKATENMRKRGVGFAEAVAAFRDKFAIDYFDEMITGKTGSFISAFPVGSY
jgi:uncharacterized DUF497 family protein